MLFFKLSAFYFFYFAATGIYVIFLPKVLNDVGYSHFDIGIVLAIAPLMRFAVPFLFLKHIKLDNKVFIAALMTSILGILCFYVTLENFYLFLFNNAILAAALSLILPYLEVIAITNLGKDKYGKSRLFGSIGFMAIAIILAKVLTSSFVAIHFYLVVIVLTAIFSILLLKYEAKEQIENTNIEKFSFFKYFAFWLALFFMQFSFGGFYNFFTIYETAHGMTLETTSYLWAFGVVCEILMLYFQAPVLKRNLETLIKLCLAITSFRWFLLYLYSNSIEIAYFTQSLHAFSFGLFHTASIMYLYSLYEDKKLAQQFMYGFAYGLGGFLGALIAGKTYGENLFLYSSIFALFAFISMLFAKK